MEIASVTQSAQIDLWRRRHNAPQSRKRVDLHQLTMWRNWGQIGLLGQGLFALAGPRFF